MSNYALLANRLRAYRVAEVDACKARRSFRYAVQRYQRKANRKAFMRRRRLGQRRYQAEMRLSEAAAALGFDLLASVQGPLVFEVNKVVVREKCTYGGDVRIHVYFGGDGRKAGDGHGHYVFTPEFALEYRREPGSSRRTQAQSPSLPPAIRISNMDRIKRVAAATFPNQVSDCA